MFILSLNNPGADAQINQTVYFMDRIPQSTLLNPAHQHDHNFYIGLPMISSMNVNGRTNFVSFSDLVYKHPQYDSLITFLHPDADIGEFTSKLKERNTVAPDLYTGILSFGFRVKKSYFSFNIAERASLRATMPKDLVLLGLEGNEQFIGKNADFSGIGADINYFREYALGYSHTIDERLSVGGRAKLLFGKANLSFTDNEIFLYTDPESYNMRLRSRFTMNFSMPVTLVKDENGDIDDVLAHFDRDDYDPGEFIFNSSNVGVAFDLGATYQLMDEIMLYASITDLGFINWKQDVHNLSMDGDFEYDGLDVSPAFDYTDDTEPGDNLLDTLKGLFSIDDNSDSYNRGLPARIYLGGTYKLNSMVSFGFLSRSEIYRNNLEQAVTLSASSDVGRWLSASLSYSAMNNSYNNLGLGLSLRGGPVNFYVLSDNVMSAFAPHRSKNVNLWFGFNLVFGKGIRGGDSELKKVDGSFHDPS